MTAGECDGGHSEFVTVRENSVRGTLITNLSFSADPSTNHIKLKLSGKDFDWFYLEGKTVRLNSSSNRILDREVHDSVLTTTVKCYEHETLQAEHRIVVEVLNENDNRPEFLQSSIQPLEISELTEVNAVAFTVQATDADGDTLTYIIDQTSPDAAYFRVDLPNSGRVFLNKPMNYESKTHLQLTLHAVESNTKEHYNTTATIMINVTDGDDQYPQFQPCILLSAKQSTHICANPVYTANITENDQDIVLDFFPGQIQAVDGDKGLRTTLTYAILSGADNGRFVIDSHSGEVRLTRRVDNRLLTPTFRLRVMAAQVDDPLKYAVATVLVRVLAENRHPPQFNRSAYRGFVRESTSPATLVMTYGNTLLTLQAMDRDFSDVFNPGLQYSLKSENNSRLFYITQEGLLIARSNQLYPNHKYSLEVVATDLESGDTVYASIQVGVLQKGQPGAGPPYDVETVGRTEGVAGVCLILLAISLFILVRCIRMRRTRRDPAIRASVAESEHPNVVDHGRQMPLVDESFYQNEAFSGYDSSTSPFYGKQGIYTKTEEPPTSSVNLPSVTLNMPRMDTGSRPNGEPANRSKTVSFSDFVMVLECHTERGVKENTEAKASLHTEKDICTDSEIKVNNGSAITKYESLTGFNTESQRIAHSDNSESEFNARLKRAITDHDTISSDSIEVETDKASAVQVRTNPELITNQHIINLEMKSSQKKVVSEEEREGDLHHDPQNRHTATQSLMSEDSRQTESPVSKEESNTSDPGSSFPETVIEKIDAGIQDGRIEITVQDTPKQNIIAQDGVTNRNKLSTMNLDSTLTVDLEQTIPNMHCVNEDIKTSLDNISPEENQESPSNLDVRDREINFLARKPDMNT
ncbi:Fat-like cadherin-related tumor suppressor -like protein [Triplophysa tibetana]|uniref:Fat-like cadherin-related tumor suppressor-like protein n=1 Tax=Triplophysa tibetana TaxID=1572043 RepID=A0A5A9P0T9_9TELE|nr:Fat-like cadherin-related tumor suppressor -like protein [Triplophysa tibetana]